MKRNTLTTVNPSPLLSSIPRLVSSESSGEISFISNDQNRLSKEFSMNSQDSYFSSLTSKNLSKQFYKTRICPFAVKGACKRGSECTYAHDRSDLKTAPDLYKTKLCTSFQKGQCSDSDCRFAHGRQELRFTNKIYKTRLCHFWLTGHCNKGTFCRHAHGYDELRVEDEQLLPPDQQPPLSLQRSISSHPHDLGQNVGNLPTTTSATPSSSSFLTSTSPPTSQMASSEELSTSFELPPDSYSSLIKHDRPLLHDGEHHHGHDGYRDKHRLLTMCRSTTSEIGDGLEETGKSRMPSIGKTTASSSSSSDGILPSSAVGILPRCLSHNHHHHSSVFHSDLLEECDAGVNFGSGRSLSQYIITSTLSEDDTGELQPPIEGSYSQPSLETHEWVRSLHRWKQQRSLPGWIPTHVAASQKATSVVNHCSIKENNESSSNRIECPDVLGSTLTVCPTTPPPSTRRSEATPLKQSMLLLKQRYSDVYSHNPENPPGPQLSTKDRVYKPSTFMQATENDRVVRVCSTTGDGRAIQAPSAEQQEYYNSNDRQFRTPTLTSIICQYLLDQQEQKHQENHQPSPASIIQSENAAAAAERPPRLSASHQPRSTSSTLPNHDHQHVNHPSHKEGSKCCSCYWRQSSNSRTSIHELQHQGNSPSSVSVPGFLVDDPYHCHQSSVLSKHQTPLPSTTYSDVGIPLSPSHYCYHWLGCEGRSSNDHTEMEDDHYYSSRFLNSPSDSDLRILLSQLWKRPDLAMPEKRAPVGRLECCASDHYSYRL